MNMVSMKRAEIEIALGWLSCTVPKNQLFEFYSLINDAPVELEVGFRGYERSAIVLGKGRVAWSDSRPEAHIDLSAMALGLLGGEKETIFKLIKWVFSLGGHLTRLDVSFDDKAGLVTVGEVKRALEDNDAVTRWRKWGDVDSSEIGKKAGSSGETVYIGSKKSDALLRVYNKALESGVPEQHWTRFELQVRDKISTNVASTLLDAWTEDEQAFIKAAFGVLRGFIEFKDFQSDINPTRRILLEWWDKFVGAYEKVRVIREKTIKSIEKTRAWLEKQVAPSLGLIHEIDGSFNWLHKEAFKGKGRWSTIHLTMLSQYNA
jgi:phage replication initiation protein